METFLASCNHYIERNHYINLGLGYLKDNATTHSVDNDIFYVVINLATRSKSYIITFIS